ncbi:MAG TPA: DUF4857 domain-containing protein, partial [Calditrichaeota bacterium]|nr:DUF4857 domain-containing protein [Calditrichota bacterium]
MLKISRLGMILLVIFISSVFIPQIYWMIFGTRIIPPRVFYSPITNGFLIEKVSDKYYYWENEEGDRFTREEGDSLLPLQSYRILAMKGKLPDSLRGHKLNIDEIRLNNIYLQVKPYYLDTPSIPLYPLFESKPARFKLEIPEYYFRIKDRIEFVSAETNKVNDSLSTVYNKALIDAGFQFPAYKVFGNPTTRKPFDEGYFIIDNNNNIFHLKRIHNQPFCANLHIPSSIKPEWLIVREMGLKEFYALLITRDNKLYLILYKNYNLQPLPVTGYDPLQHNLKLYGNLFYRSINILSKTDNHTYVTDRNYALLDTLHVQWPGKYDTPAGKISKYLFPFTLRFVDSSSMYTGFYFSPYNFQSLFISLFIFIFTLFFIYKKHKKISALS